MEPFLSPVLALTYMSILLDMTCCISALVQQTALIKASISVRQARVCTWGRQSLLAHRLHDQAEVCGVVCRWARGRARRR